MATVRDLFKILKDHNDDWKELVVVKNNDGNYIPLVRRFYVEDNILFLYTKSEDNIPLSTDYLRFYLENESVDECWDICQGESSFLDCDVCIVFGDADNVDDTSDLVLDVDYFAGNNKQLSCICDYDTNNENDESVENDEDVIRNIILQLSAKEVDMICESLNYYGDKVADSVGYSSGEKYWDLMNRIKCNK